MKDARSLYLAGSLGAFYYLVAQTFQQVVYAKAGAPADVTAEWLSRLTAADQTRALLLWISFLALPIVYHAMYAGTKQRRPHWAAIGLGASLGFVGCELAYRTLEVFVVAPRWTAQWATALPPARAALAERLALWDELVVGWYVLLLTAHLVGTVAFAVAIGWRRPLIDRALFVTLVASAGLMFVRLAAYLLPALDPLWQTLYFPVNAPGFLALAAALFSWSRQDPAR